LAGHKPNTNTLRSKSWNEFESVPLDLVITVCSNTKSKKCPLFKGNLIRINWDIPNPAKVKGSDEQKLDEFYKVYAQIENLIKEEVGISLPSRPVKIKKPSSPLSMNVGLIEKILNEDTAYSLCHKRHRWRHSLTKAKSANLILGSYLSGPTIPERRRKTHCEK